MRSRERLNGTLRHQVACRKQATEIGARRSVEVMRISLAVRYDQASTTLGFSCVPAEGTRGTAWTAKGESHRPVALFLHDTHFYHANPWRPAWHMSCIYTIAFSIS
jgi:hypothetical protein